MLDLVAFVLSVLLALAFISVSVIIYLKYKDITKNINSIDHKVETNEEDVNKDFNNLKSKVQTASIQIGSVAMSAHPEYPDALRVSSSNKDSVIFAPQGMAASNLAVIGDTVSMGQTYSLGGITSFSNIGVMGDVNATGSINAPFGFFDKLYASNLDVVTALNVSNATIKDLNVTGMSSFSSGSFVDLNVKGIGTLSNLIVNGTATANSYQASNAAFSNAKIINNLQAGNIRVGSGVTVGQDIALGRDLRVGQDLAVNRNLTAAKNATVQNDLLVNSTATIKKNLVVEETGSMYANNAILNNVQVNGAMKVRQKVNVITTNPGPIIEVANGGMNLGDRYGMGQWPNGTTRLYAANATPNSTINLSYAKTDGNFNDALRVSQAGTNVLQGQLCMQNECITKDQFGTLRKLALANSNL